jgi:hypothetical protein
MEHNGIIKNISGTSRKRRFTILWENGNETIETSRSINVQAVQRPVARPNSGQMMSQIINSIAHEEEDYDSSSESSKTDSVEMETEVLNEVNENR